MRHTFFCWHSWEGGHGKEYAVESDFPGDAEEIISVTELHMLRGLMFESPDGPSSSNLQSMDNVNDIAALSGLGDHFLLDE